MPIARILRSNFTAGELSPRLEDRYSLAKQQNGCRAILNCAVTPHGTLYARSGTRFIAEPSFESSTYRLFPFTFSTEDAYQLLFGNLKFEIYRTGGRIEDGGSPVTVTHSWSDDQLFELVWSQSADNIYIVHEDAPQKVITRSSHVDWTVNDWSFFAETSGRIQQPHFKFEDSAVTLASSGTTGTVTLTASTAIFRDAHVGTRFRKGNKEVEITAVPGTGEPYTTATALVKETITTAATDDWTEQAFSAVRGYPRTVTVHQNRLAIGGSRDIPNRYWLSKSADWLNFDEGNGDDDDAIVNDLGAGLAVNGITWMQSYRGALFIGTLARPWIIGSGSSTDNTVTPTQIEARAIDGPGGPLQNANVVNGAVAYIDNTRRRLIGLRYSLDADSFEPEDLTLLAEHITAGGLVEFAWQRDKENIGWGVRSDGYLLGFTYMPAHDVGGWHRHLLGGSGEVKSVSMMTTPTRDEAWLVVKREIGGMDKFFVERLEPKFEGTTAPEDAFFVDSGLTYEGSPVASVSGLGHLEGLEVRVLGDGGYVGAFSVESGSVTLPDTFSTIHAGLAYDPIFEVGGSDDGGTEGSTQGVKKRIIEFELDVINTHRVMYGETASTLYPLVFSEYPVALDQMPPLTTGSKGARFSTGWRDDIRFTVKAPDPLPMEVRSVMLRTAVNG